MGFSVRLSSRLVCTPRVMVAELRSMALIWEFLFLAESRTSAIGLLSFLLAVHCYDCIEVSVLHLPSPRTTFSAEVIIDGLLIYCWRYVNREKISVLFLQRQPLLQ